MTSQIAIFNQRGVGVASDTVSTVTSGAGTKTINNTEKIWELGGDHLAVVVISGNSSINLVDARLLLAEWGKTLPGPMSTVQTYAENFSNWLAAEQGLVPVHSEAQVALRCLENHYLNLRNRVNSSLDLADGNEVSATPLLVQYATDAVEYLKQQPPYSNVTDEFDSAYLNSEDFDLEGLLKNIFDEIPGYELARSTLAESGTYVLSRFQPMRFDTTLGFIGFGTDEYFAKSVRMVCRGRYGGTARVVIGDPFGLTHENIDEGVISCFAQQDAIHGFIRGAHYEVEDLILDSIGDHIFAKYENQEEGYAEARAVVESVREKIRTAISEQYVYPMLELISTLNLRDVAELASSLVGIQAMRANASPEPPGVGGLIESLVIDRVEGVRWVKRLPKLRNVEQWSDEKKVVQGLPKTF